MKVSPPILLPINQLLPETPNLLMGAGPVPIPKEVALANTLVINHLGETMKNIVTGLQAMSQYVFQTSSNKIFGIAGPSSAAMEMAVTSLLWPGRKVLVLNLGIFSGRFAELAHGVGAEVTELHPLPFSSFTALAVKEAITKNHYDVLTIVQGETSCGIQNVELGQIIKVARDHGLQTIVDAVSTLSTMPLPMEEWGIDVVVTGGQKGLSSVAGVSLIAFSEKTFDFISKREARMPHWCLDARRAYRFWVLHEYHYTAPVSGIMALYEALRLICVETLEKRFERHLFYSTTLQHCLTTMGLEFYAPKECRLNSVLAIKNQNAIHARELINHMTKTYQVEISGAFGLDIIRIGQMGEQCRPDHVRRVIEAVGLAYNHLGANLNVSGALSEFESALGSLPLRICV